MSPSSHGPPPLKILLLPGFLSTIIINITKAEPGCVCLNAFTGERDNTPRH